MTSGMTGQGTASRPCGIVLAAGFSSRAGAFKMGLDLAGRPVLHRVLATMLPFVDEIVVVGGHAIETTAGLVAEFNRQRSACAGAVSGENPAIRVVANPGYASGMFSSVRAGARAMPAGAAAFLIPGDCPLVRPAVYAALLGASAAVAIPVAAGKKGHPVLLGAAVVAALAGADAAAASGNLKDFLAGFATELVPVEDSAIWRDLDTPEDYAALQELATASDGVSRHDGAELMEKERHDADQTTDQ